VTARPFPSTQRGVAARLGALVLLPVRPFARLDDVFSLLLYPLVLVVGFVMLFVPRRRDAVDGTVLISRGLFRTRRVDLARAEWVRLSTSVDDVLDTGAMLLAKGGGEQVRVVMFADSVLRRTCLPGWALRSVADGLANNGSLSAGEIVDLLRRQAAHLDGGRPLGDSPLGEFARRERDLTAVPGDGRIG
jgi:hypothetical protein